MPTVFPLYLCMVVCNASTVPASVISDPDTIIPQGYVTRLSPIPKPGIPSDAFFSASTQVFSFFARSSYNLVLPRKVNIGVAGVEGSVQPFQTSTSQYRIKYILWGLLRCTKGIVATGLDDQGKYTASKCAFGPSRQNLVGTYDISGRGPRNQDGSDTPCTDSNQDQNSANSTSTLSPAGQASSNNTDASQIENICIKSHSMLPQQPGTGNSSQNLAPHPKEIALLLMEAMLELAAQIHRPPNIQSPWFFEYTSVTQGYKITLKTPEGETRPFEFARLMNELGTLGGDIGWVPGEFTLWAYEKHQTFERLRRIVEGQFSQVRHVTAPWTETF